MRAWLMKSEPEVYSVDDLRRDERTLWTGIRNYQARNYMSQDMALGDAVLLYHSNADPPGIAGLLRVSGAARPDPTQFDKKSEYHEPRATKDKPVWACVEVTYVAKATPFVSLEALRKRPELAGMLLLQKGSRLSIQPVEPGAFATICALAGLEPPAAT